ncbi:sulfatase-like hydrolase/transferase [Halorarum halophilum]|uniref:Sulfatase-like hydrolase/transferase n=1 Tax=Halorarum halophilum TaxID=2743090 RepID=A0A7D5G9X8_9EURY|nr:sulfatase-like hydrolase/transferase [Halobaculum halophilum]QLG26092.1 sulfatase-like hydrolase/transferase [Halobaculum halophilum]
MTQSPSIAVVVLDTLRKDAFDEAFDWLPGLRFENAWSTSHWTVPVHASLFAGKYASDLGVHVGNQYLDCPEPVLAEQLADAGYTTRAFSCNPNISKPFAFDRGFDEFHGSWRLRGLEENVFDWQSFIAETRGDGIRRYLEALWQCIHEDCATWPSIKRGFRLKLYSLTPSATAHVDDGACEALDYIRRAEFDRPEFLFVNLMEAHGPYTPPEEYITTGSREEVVERTTYNGLVATVADRPPNDAEYLRRTYDDAVRYLSDIYRDMFQELRASFDYVITLSDHGELFGEHDAWQHAYGVYPELTHVPLVISGDGIPDESFPETVSLIDVHSTVRSLTGLDANSCGTSLVEVDDSEKLTVTPPDSSYFTEYHGVNPLNRAAVVEAGFDPSPFDEQLYGVKSPTTPYAYETLDGVQSSADGDPATAADTIKRHRSQATIRVVEDAGEVSDVVRRRLEELGYA